METVFSIDFGYLSSICTKSFSISVLDSLPLFIQVLYSISQYMSSVFVINSLKESLIREKTMHEYKVNIVKVIDGDTVDVDIDLGFGIWLKKERVRIMGIDTPESRTSDKLEKVFGLAAKERLSSLLGQEAILRTQVSKKGEDMKGKFGRVLGDFDTIHGESVSGKLMTEGHAVVYMGGSKDATQSQHIENRHKLVDNGTVILPEGYTVTKKRTPKPEEINAPVVEAEAVVLTKEEKIKAAENINAFRGHVVMEDEATEVAKMSKNLKGNIGSFDSDDYPEGVLQPKSRVKLKKGKKKAVKKK